MNVDEINVFLRRMIILEANDYSPLLESPGGSGCARNHAAPGAHAAVAGHASCGCRCGAPAASAGRRLCRCGRFSASGGRFGWPCRLGRACRLGGGGLCGRWLRRRRRVVAAPTSGASAGLVVRGAAHSADPGGDVVPARGHHVVVCNNDRWRLQIAPAALAQVAHKVVLYLRQVHTDKLEIVLADGAQQVVDLSGL